jgi:hypothetical protein
MVMGMLCLVATPSIAQKIKIELNNEEPDERISPLLKEKIDEYALEIREIVVREKLEMETEIDQVNEKLKNQEMTEKEADNEKAQIALKFSEKINNSIENLDFNLDEITKQQVKYSIMNTDLDELKQEKEQKRTKTYKRMNEVRGYLGYGMIHLPKDDHQKLNDHLGFSSGIDFGLIYHRQLNRTSPFEFISGLYLSYRTIRFEDDYFIYRNGEGVVDLIKHEGRLKKSKLRTAYVMVPLGITYHTSRLQTDAQGNAYRKIESPFSIGVNMYGGFKIGQNNIVKGEDINWRHRKKSLNNNNFAYGLQLNLGVNNWDFYVRQELSTFFKENTFDDRKMLQFGINFGF